MTFDMKPGDFWTCAHGGIYRHNQDPDSTMAFQYAAPDDLRWCNSSSPGRGPWTKCRDPSMPEARTGAALRRWMVEHPGRVVMRVGTTEQYLWHGGLAESHHTPWTRWERHAGPQDDLCVPQDGTW